jgi:hypothetical protein
LREWIPTSLSLLVCCVKWIHAARRVDGWGRRANAARVAFSGRNLRAVLDRGH